MENEKRAYLDRIAQDNRTSPKADSGLPFDPKMLLKIVGIVFGVLFLLLGIVAISNSLNRDTVQERDLIDKLDYRAKNLNTTLENYRGDVREATVRANILTLQSILTKMSTDLEMVLLDGNFSGEASAAVIEEEEDYIAGVDATLARAKINGTLDRTIVRQLTLETALILTMEDECLNRTEDENLVLVLNDSHTNLEKLYEEFDKSSN